jgi:hypothetical protein
MTSNEAHKWYQKTWGIVALLVLFFPAGLFLMWKHAKWNKVVKSVVTGVFVLLIMGMMNAEPSATPATQNQNSATSEKPAKEVKQETVYKLDEPIQGKSLEVTVTDVTQKTSVGSQYLNEKASEGAILIAIQWQYKNTSDKPVKSYSKPEMKLIDSNNTEYNSDLGKTSYYATEAKLDSKVWSDLNPGITVKDAAVFEISKEAYAKGGWVAIVKLDGKNYKITLN